MSPIQRIDEVSGVPVPTSMPVWPVWAGWSGRLRRGGAGNWRDQCSVPLNSGWLAAGIEIGVLAAATSGGLAVKSIVSFQRAIRLLAHSFLPSLAGPMNSKSPTK